MTWYTHCPESFHVLRLQVYAEHNVKPSFHITDPYSTFWVLDAWPIARAGFALIHHNQPYLRHHPKLTGPEVSQFFIRKDWRGNREIMDYLAKGLQDLHVGAVGLVRPSLARYANAYFKANIAHQVGPAHLVAGHQRAYHRFSHV